MGGFGSGGARVGSGQRRKDDATRALHGSRNRDKRKPQDEAPVVPSAVKPPAHTTPEQLAVWAELAPHALAAKTLTPGTAESFRQLCEAIVIRRGLLASIEKRGYESIRVTTDVTSGEQHIETKANSLLSRYTAMMQRVEAGMARFKLAPVGKEIAPTEKPKDEWAEFDDPTVQ